MKTVENQNVSNDQMNQGVTSKDGRVLPPLLLYFLGVPFGVCLILWFLFFRG